MTIPNFCTACGKRVEGRAQFCATNKTCMDFVRQRAVAAAGPRELRGPQVNREATKGMRIIYAKSLAELFLEGIGGDE